MEHAGGWRRRGALPRVHRYATVVHKTQGISIGLGKLIEYLIAHVANNVSMESKFLGLLYVLHSRVRARLARSQRACHGVGVPAACAHAHAPRR